MDNSKKNTSSDEEMKIKCIELLIESNSQKLLDFIKKNDS